MWLFARLWVRVLYLPFAGMAAWARYINLINLSPFIGKSERVIVTTQIVCVCGCVILQGNSLWKHPSITPRGWQVSSSCSCPFN